MFKSHMDFAAFKAKSTGVAYEQREAPDLAKLATTIDQIGQAFQEHKAANDERLAKMAKGESVAEIEAKLARISKELDKLEDLKSTLEAVQTKLARPGALGHGGSNPLEAEIKSFSEIGIRRGGQVDAESYLAYKNATAAFLRANGNLELLSELNRRSMQAGIDSEGGYLVTPPATAAVVTKVREMSAIRGIAGQISISTNAIEGLVDRGDAAAAWVGELSARTATTTPTLGKDRIEVFEIYSFPDFSQQLLEDAAIDLEAWLIDKVATAFAEAENAAFISGDGVVKPRGFTTYTTAATADGSRTWGQLQHVVSGANGAFHTTKADPLMDLIAAFKPGYLQNATFLMNRATLAAVRKLKEASTDRYLWEPSLQAGVPSRLLGYPVVLDEGMPAFSGTGSLAMALGDFRRGYLIVDRLGMSMLRDPYTNKPKVGLYVRRRVGGAVRDFDAIKFIKFSA